MSGLIGEEPLATRMLNLRAGAPLCLSSLPEGEFAAPWLGCAGLQPSGPVRALYSRREKGGSVPAAGSRAGPPGRRTIRRATKPKRKGQWPLPLPFRACHSKREVALTEPPGHW